MRVPEGHAPFNFVSAANPIGWEKGPAHDASTYSGTLTIKICALEPILVCGAQEQGKPRRFFTRNGKPCIPGSSIKGVIRSMLEAMSMSHLSQITPRKMSFRNLNSPAYLDRFVKRADGVSVYRSRAGFLRKGSSGWEILPCEWAKVSTRELAKQQFEFKPACTQPTQRVEFLLNSPIAKRGVANVLPQSADHAHPNPKDPNRSLQLRYRRVNAVTLGGDAKLVVAGHMSGRHFESIFYPPTQGASALSVEHAWEDFEAWLDSHKRRRELFNQLRGKKAQEMYPHGIPVFWIESGARGNPTVEAFGFSQLFCVPYKKSLTDLVEFPEDKEEPFSLAEKIFGYADLKLGTSSHSQRGRVSFGAAVCVKQTAPLRAERVIPGNPSPTCVGLYLEQQDARAIQRTAKDDGLQTYDDDRSQLRGRKFYWHRPRAWGNAAPNPSAPADQSNVSAEYEPLDGGAEFETLLQFERLSQLELGAMLAAIELPEGHAHKIGLGKPFGLGSVRLSIIAQDIQPTAQHYSSLRTRMTAAPAVDLAAFKKQFEDRIAEICQCAFETIPEIRSLRVLTDYAQAPSKQTTAYMPLQRAHKDDKESPVYANKPVLPNAETVFRIPRRS